MARRQMPPQNKLHNRRKSPREIKNAGLIIPQHRTGVLAKIILFYTLWGRGARIKQNCSPIFDGKFVFRYDPW